MAKINPIIQAKLDKLRVYYTDEDSLSIIDGYEKKLRDLIKDKKIPQMAPIIQIVNEGQKVVEDINLLLQNDKTLTTEERTRLFEKKECYQFFISRLNGARGEAAESTLESILDHRIKIIEDKNPIG